MELRQWDRFFLKFLLLCAAGIVVTEVLGQEWLTSYLFLATFPLTVILWARSVRKTLTGLDILMLLTILLAVVNVILNLWINGGTLSFDFFRKVIMFSMSLMFLQTANRFRVGQEIVDFMTRIADLLTLFFVLMYFWNRPAMHVINGYVTGYLTFGFSNPNTTGLFLTCLYMLELYRLYTREVWYLKTLHVGMACVLFWFVFETQSRNCLLVMLLFTVYCLWLVFRSKRMLRVTGFWAGMIAWFPLTFAALYMTVIYTPWIQRIFGFAVSAGKNLDSRVDIWTNTLSYIKHSPLIGSYYEISGGTGVAQMHNSHLDIAASYGIAVLVLVCVLLTRYLLQRGRVYESKERYIYMLGFSCTLLLGLGEAALFSGGLGIHLFAGMLLMLANGKNDTQQEVFAP